jgi:hypothetical protein
MRKLTGFAKSLRPASMRDASSFLSAIAAGGLAGPSIEEGQA